MLNAIGLDSSAVGNHEFDKGIADLQDRIIPAAEWDYLGANVTVDGSPMQEYSLHEVSGLTVGVIGVVTEETPTLVSPGGMTGVEFSDPVEAVNRVAAQLSDGDDSNGEADMASRRTSAATRSPPRACPAPCRPARTSASPSPTWT